MYTISKQLENKLKSRSSIKKGYLKLIPLSNIEEEYQFLPKDIREFTILDEIYNEDKGIIGTAVAKQLEVTLYNEQGEDLVNREIQAFIGVEGSTEYIPFGNFIIQKPEENGITDKSYFIGLDYMIKFNKAYEDTITYPCKPKQLLQNICNQCEVELVNKTYVNENFTIENNQFVEGESCREVLKALCQLFGGYARINRENKLEIICPTQSQKTNTYTTSDYTIDININNTYGGVNRLVIDMSQVDGSQVIREDKQAQARDGVQELVISDNPFLYTEEKRIQVIENLFNALKGLKYTDYEMKVLTSLPNQDAGDKIQIEDKEGNLIDTYVLSQEIVYDGKLVSHLSATAETEMETKYSYTPPIPTRQRRTEITLDKESGRIDLLSQDMYGEEGTVSRLGVEVGKISSEVNSYTNFTKEVKGKNRIILEDAIETNILKLVLNAENSFSGLYPSPDLYPSENLYPQRGGNSFTIKVANDNAETIFKEYKINAKSTLREYNGIHDQLILELDQKTGKCSVKVIKRIKKVGNVYTIYNPAIEILLFEDYPFTLYKGNNYISINEYKDWEMEATYIFNNKLNEYFATKVETSTSINQTQNNIMLQVSRQLGDKADKNALISQINLSPEEIAISSNKIKLEGYTTINNGFSIDEEGNASIANGAVEINNEGIHLADGTSVIGGKGLITNLVFTSTANANPNIVLQSGEFRPVGFNGSYTLQGNFRTSLYVDAFIPENFTIVKAFMTLQHFPLRIYDGNTFKGYGYARKVKLYQASNGSQYITYRIGSDYLPGGEEGSFEMEDSGMGTNGWTPQYEDNIVDTLITNDISKYLSNGFNRFVVQSSDSIPSYSTNTVTEETNTKTKTGMMYAVLQVYGFLRIEGSDNQ